MPLQDQTLEQYHDLPETWEDIDNSMYRSHIASAITSGLDDSAYFSDPMLTTSIESIIPNQDHHHHHYRTTSGDEFESETEGWRRKPVKLWNNLDILHWISSVALQQNVCCTQIAGEKFGALDGIKLMEFNEADFINCDRKYGTILYQKLQDLISPSQQELLYNQLMPVSTQPCDTPDYGLHSQPDLSMEKYIPTYIDMEMKEKQFSTIPNLEQVHESQKKPEKNEKKRRSRKPDRSKKPVKIGRLWEFIRDLLKNKEYCPSLIVWDNYEEGMFRFVHSDKVAKLWGIKKDNPDMNYEKLSRAMRYYYKSKVLQPVLGRRLVYKFGPSATGWQVENPNFKH